MGGATIAEVLRRAWSRLIRKQWLVFYPVALAVVNTLAFLAVYAAGGEVLSWSRFFTANFDRWQYVRDHFFTDFAFTPPLYVALVAGLVVCLFSAMIRAPYFRAIGGLGYPTTPRNPPELGNLALLYLFTNVLIWVVPVAAPSGAVYEQVIALLVLVVAILLVFADYVVVFEQTAFLPALRRSFQLLTRRWPTVIVVFAVFQLVYFGLNRLYALYYESATTVSFLLPLSQILVEAIVVLVFDLLLIFLYEQIRLQGRSR